MAAKNLPSSTTGSPWLKTAFWAQRVASEPLWPAKRSRPRRHLELKLLAKRRHPREGIPRPFAVQRRPRVPRAFPPPQVLRADQLLHGCKFVVAQFQVVHFLSRTGGTNRLGRRPSAQNGGPHFRGQNDALQPGLRTAFYWLDRFQNGRERLAIYGLLKGPFSQLGQPTRARDVGGVRAFRNGALLVRS
jgi:hypothetical protein